MLIKFCGIHEYSTMNVVFYNNLYSETVPPQAGLIDLEYRAPAI